MKISYTAEEWTNFGILENVPVHRTEQVVYALNYTLGWLENNSMLDNNYITVLPIIVMTIATIIDLNDNELSEILNDAHNTFGDYVITHAKYHMNAMDCEAEFNQEFCDKVIRKHQNKLQLN
jgi:hydrogenase maturation factor